MLSKLAEDMAYTLDITNDEHCRKDFSDALEDGDVCSELVRYGYTQEEIEQVHDELVYQTAEISLNNSLTYDHFNELDEDQKERILNYFDELTELMGDRPREVSNDEADHKGISSNMEFLEIYLENAIFDLVI